MDVDVPAVVEQKENKQGQQAEEKHAEEKKGKKKEAKQKDEVKIKKPSSNDTKAYEARKKLMAKILELYGGQMEPDTDRFAKLDFKAFADFYNEGNDPCPLLSWTSHLNALHPFYLQPANVHQLPHLMFSSLNNVYHYCKVLVQQYDEKMAAFMQVKQAKDAVRLEERQRKRKEKDELKAATKKQKKESGAAVPV